MPDSDFGPWLRRRRQRAGLSIRAAERAIGTSRGYLNLLERSQRCPSQTMAELIADAYDLRGADYARLMGVAVSDAGRDSPYKTGARDNW